MSIFNNQNSETLLTQVYDSGLSSGSLTMKIHGKHLFLEMKSPHAIMTIITNKREDIHKMRAALKTAEKLYDEESEKEKASRNSITATQADSELRKIRDREKTTATKSDSGKASTKDKRQKTNKKN